VEREREREIAKVRSSRLGPGSDWLTRFGWLHQHQDWLTHLWIWWISLLCSRRVCSQRNLQGKGRCFEGDIKRLAFFLIQMHCEWRRMEADEIYFVIANAGEWAKTFGRIVVLKWWIRRHIWQSTRWQISDMSDKVDFREREREREVYSRRRGGEGIRK